MAHTRHARGALVRAFREARNLTLTELGEAAQLDPGYLSRVEHGIRRASFSATTRLAEALGVDALALCAQAPPYRDLRRLLGLGGPQEFAQSIGMDPDRLCDIEAGRIRATEGELAVLGARFGLDPALLGDHGLALTDEEAT